MLSDPKVLAGMGFNQREVDYLSRQPWWSLSLLYYSPYLDSFKQGSAESRIVETLRV
jgi:hypothetical protein